MAIVVLAAMFPNHPDHRVNEEDDDDNSYAPRPSLQPTRIRSQDLGNSASRASEMGKGDQMGGSVGGVHHQQRAAGNGSGKKRRMDSQLEDGDMKRQAQPQAASYSFPVETVTSSYGAAGRSTSNNSGVVEPSSIYYQQSTAVPGVPAPAAATASEQYPADSSSNNVIALLAQLIQQANGAQNAEQQLPQAPAPPPPPPPPPSQPMLQQQQASPFLAHLEQLALARAQLDTTMQASTQQGGRAAAESNVGMHQHGQIQPDGAQPQLASAQQQQNLLDPQIQSLLLANFSSLLGNAASLPQPQYQPVVAPPPPPPPPPPVLNTGSDQLLSGILNALLNAAAGSTTAASSSSDSGVPSPHPVLSSQPYHQFSEAAAAPSSAHAAFSSSSAVETAGGPSSSNNAPSHAASASSGAGTSSKTPRRSGKSVLLYVPKDEGVLSTYQCLVRKQIELFEASDDDVQFTISKMSKPVVAGQVGIRCRHCAVLPQYARPKAAVYFPRSLDSMYQFGQNMVKNHLAVPCKKIPPATQRRLLELQEERKRGRGGRERWAEGAKELGVIETPSGLRFKKNTS
eukprot:Nitzschia sp. Nitz4//scaffold149_size55946//8726//10575//NITZ4_006587-RA/size55946-augustus-gene-0.62-mRNA-1//1//CDS//3329536788//7339//frame0